MKKTLFVQISDFGSIADVNRWKPKEETLFYWRCRNYPLETVEFKRTVQTVTPNDFASFIRIKV